MERRRSGTGASAGSRSMECGQSSAGSGAGTSTGVASNRGVCGAGGCGVEHRQSGTDSCSVAYTRGHSSTGGSGVEHRQQPRPQRRPQAAGSCSLMAARTHADR